MSEPIEINDLEQLSVTIAVTLPLPDGREAVVRLRPLTAKEIRNIRRSIEWPEPPVKDFKKDGGGSVEPVYNYRDKEYKRLTEEADALLVNRMLVASLQMNIPGETVEEKCAALDARLGQFAVTHLINVMNRINTPSAEEVANVMRSFRSLGTAGASDDGQSLTYALGVEGLIENRSGRDDGLSAGRQRKARAAIE